MRNVTLQITCKFPKRLYTPLRSSRASPHNPRNLIIVDNDVLGGGGSSTVPA